LIGVEAEGSTIPEAVPIEGVVPEIQEATGAAPELAEVASGGAPAMAEEERDEVLPESNLVVVFRSAEIQDVKPIRSVPMSGTAKTVTPHVFAQWCFVLMTLLTLALTTHEES
jgi:hypothetical protein